MSLRRQEPKDSLDMLLDTMCNAFGGIILLAVLVALLSRQHPGAPGNTRDNAEMISNQIEQAEKAVAGTREFIGWLSDPANHEKAVLVGKKGELQNILQGLDKQAKEAESILRGGASSDPAERIEEIKQGRDRAIVDLTQASNKLGIIRRDNSNKVALIGNVGWQITNAQQNVTQRLRLPRERQTTKNAFNIIMQYGRLYPLRDASLDRNDKTISWRPSGTGFTTIPLKDNGLDPRTDAAAIALFFKGLPRGRFYIAFYVFEDSFSAFNAAKRMAVAAGQEYGWEPKENSEGPLSFGPKGTSPLAQ